jgi:hypothetical protein
MNRKSPTSSGNARMYDDISLGSYAADTELKDTDEA